MTKDLPRFLSSRIKAVRTIYISSYIPRQCGVATFTKNLTNAVNLLNPYSLAEIVAVNRDRERLNYPKEVKLVINNQEHLNYLRAAEWINQSGADLVSLQYEQSLFNCRGGDYLQELITGLKLPLVITAHSIPDDPNSSEGAALKKILAKARATVVMVGLSREKLIKDYDLPAQEVVVIPHGIPDLPYGLTEKAKRKKQLADRPILGSINLISSPKGIEYALRSVAIIKKSLPRVLYLIIGKTHPVVLQQDGEVYRWSLKKLIQELGIEKNVKFVNRYLTLEELIGWLKAIDVYITPYLWPKQAASGALSYALGAGKFCVSTPYLYAKEVLADNRGVLTPFRNPQIMAKKIIYFWNHPKQKMIIEKNAYDYGRLMTWPNVALQYFNLFKLIISQGV